MWMELAGFLQANAREALIISIIGTVVVWLYKQFKGMIDREQEEKLSLLHKKQGLFTKLELSIAATVHLNNPESKQRMYDWLGECGPYLTDTQRRVVRDYYQGFNTELLHSLQALTVSEVDKISRQLAKLDASRDGVEWLDYMKRLYIPVLPIVFWV